MSNRVLVTLEGVDVVQSDDGRVSYTAGARVDADGANGATCDPITGKPLFAYAPGNKGMDDTANAGYPGTTWYHTVLVCDAARRPITILRPFSNFPNKFLTGYISQTAYVIKGKPREDRYLDSVAVPYIVVSPLIRQRAKGIVLGCKARVTRIEANIEHPTSNIQRSIDCIVGDIGPAAKIGELSIAAANALGINSNPRTGGLERKEVLYEFFPDQPAVVNGITYELQPA